MFLTVLLCYAFSTQNFARSEINLGDVVGDIPVEETNKQSLIRPQRIIVFGGDKTFNVMVCTNFLLTAIF